MADQILVVVELAIGCEASLNTIGEHGVVARRAAAASHGLHHRVHNSVPAALASHQRWLRAMGRNPALS